MRTLFLIITFILIILPTSAQGSEANTLDCESPNLLDVVSELLSSETSPIEKLIAIRDASSRIIVQCTGLTFNHIDHDGKVVGPFTFGDEIYVVTVHSANGSGVTLEFTELEGNCRGGAFILINIKDGGQEIFRPAGCEALFHFSSTTPGFGNEPDWNVTFEKMR